jgi:hypothetical protein
MPASLSPSMFADLQSTLSLPLLFAIPAPILTLFLFLISPKKEALRVWIFHRRVHRYASRRSKLVELLDFVIVTEAITPPAGHVVYAVPLHSGQKLPSAVVCARQFLLLLGFGSWIALSRLFNRLLYLRY